jgi:proline iminopeptidase
MPVMNVRDVSLYVRTMGSGLAPTLIMAGRDDFVFPREHQAHLAAAISNTRLHIVERASPIPHGRADR